MQTAPVDLRDELDRRIELIEDLERQLKGRDATIERMQGQLEELIRRIYGRKSERLNINQLLLDGLILEADKVAPPPPSEEVVTEKEASSKPRNVRVHTGRKPLPDHLPRHEIIIPVSEEEKICPETGDPRPFMGYEESQKLEYIPETLRVNVYKREKYGSPLGSEEVGVVTALKTPALVEKCLADTGLLAHVVVSKYDDHRVPRVQAAKMALSLCATV